DGTLRERALRLLAAIEGGREAIAARAQALEGELEGGRSAGEQMASELRACAGEEAELQRVLREAGELVTEAEVKAQRGHDELRALIADTDKQIERTFQRTFAAAAENFSELVDEMFPGGSGKLRLVSEERAPRPVLGGQPLSATAPGGGEEDGEEAQAEAAAE